MAFVTALLCLMAFAGSSNGGLVRGAGASHSTRGTFSEASGRKLLLSGKQGADGSYTDKPELDFSTEDVQRSPFQASDFVFDFPMATVSTPFGNLRNENVNNRPALATLPNGSVTQTLVTLEACAINQPHSHPRGTEFSWVTEGESHP